MVGTLRVGSPNSPEAKALQVMFDEHAANERKLRAIWEDALREHYGEFMAVTDWGKKVWYDSSMDALVAAIPEGERPAAAHDVLVDQQEPLILVA